MECISARMLSVASRPRRHRQAARSRRPPFEEAAKVVDLIVNSVPGADSSIFGRPVPAAARRESGTVRPRSETSSRSGETPPRPANSARAARNPAPESPDLGPPKRGRAVRPRESHGSISSRTAWPCPRPRPSVPATARRSTPRPRRWRPADRASARSPPTSRHTSSRVALRAEVMAAASRSQPAAISARRCRSGVGQAVVLGAVPVLALAPFGRGAIRVYVAYVAVACGTIAVREWLRLPTKAVAPPTSPAWPGREPRCPCRPASDSHGGARRRQARGSDAPG